MLSLLPLPAAEIELTPRSFVEWAGTGVRNTPVFFSLYFEKKLVFFAVDYCRNWQQILDDIPLKKILVTGSNGLLGQKLTDLCLQSSDISLVACSRGNNRHPVKSGYLYEDIDVLDFPLLKKVIEFHKPDSIIHTAAMTNVDSCELEKEQCRQLNVGVVQVLAEICAELDIHFVHLSTDFIFDGENGPYPEEFEPSPLSYYGQSKLDAERVLTDSKCRSAILRTIIVYGVVSDMSRSNIVLWAKNALEKGQPVQVVDDQWRMPTLAEDLAEGCLLAVKKGAEGVFNVSGSDMMSILDIVEAVADFWKLDKSLIQPISADSLNQAAKRPKKTGFVLEKAMGELGYRPRSFQEGLSIVDQQLESAENR